MRNALGLMLASVVAAVVIAAGGWFYYSSRADQAAPKTIAARAADQLPAPAKLAARDDVETTAAIAGKPAVPAPAPAPAMPVQQKSTCANPNALGVSRVVEIDTTGGPGFGFETFKQFDFLTDKEVVLTFDDSPWPVNTPAVLKALADECTKGLFFSVGKHATYHPEILRQVLAQGHTVGTHTWSHLNLNSKKLTEQQAKDEIEKGFSAVKLALGTNPAPFFRFPQLQHNPAMVSYLGTRNVAMWSTDLDSFDFRKGATTREDRRDGDDQARQARQGHRPDARLSEAHRRGTADAARTAQGRRLQNRADQGEDHLPDAAGVRRGAAEGPEGTDLERASDRKRGADGFAVTRPIRSKTLASWPG
ncbi:peptidoglycan/xylan/chitin deacetylase (PgdA/CDA1 family) [Bradyrhizobium sp. LM3.4]